MPDYLFNTTALSNFAAIDRFDLLKKLYLSYYPAVYFCYR